MWEENMNMQNATPNVGSSFSQYKTSLKNLSQRRKQISQMATDSSINKMNQDSENLFQLSCKTWDEKMSRECKRQSQLAAVASMIKYDAANHWANWDDISRVNDVFSRFFSYNADPDNRIYNAIDQFADSDWDPEEFWIKMWWIPTDEEDQSLNWLERVIQWLWMPWKMLTQWWYDLAAWAERSLWNWDYARVLALDDYAYNKYWKVVEDMTDEEIRRLELDLKLHPELLQEREDRENPNVAWTEIALWWGLLWLEMAYPKAMVWITAAWETPVVWWPIQMLWLAWYGIWSLVSMVPPVNWWIASLPEDLQEDVKSIWGNLILWRSIQKWWFDKNWNLRPQIKQFLSNIDSNLMIWAIMDYIANEWAFKAWEWTRELADYVSWEWAYKMWEWTRWMLDNAKGTIKKFKEWINDKEDLRQREQDLQNFKEKNDYAWRIWAVTDQKRAIEESNIVRRALENLDNESMDINNMTTEELLDILTDQSKSISAYEKGIYSLDERRYTPRDSRRVKNTTDPMTWESSPKIKDPIWDWIKLLKDIFEDNSDIVTQIELIEKRRKKIWLTRWEANVLAQMISEWAKIYREWSRDKYTTDYIKKAEAVRRALKERAREPYKNIEWFYKVLETLDSVWSDNLNTQALLKNEMNKAQAYVNSYPHQSSWQKQWEFAMNTKQSWWKNILSSLFNSKKYNTTTREAELPTNLKNFYKLNKKDWWINYMKMVKDWYDKTFRDIVPTTKESEYVWEWEVINRNPSWIDKNYLDEILETVEIIESAEWVPAKAKTEVISSLEKQLEALGFDEATIEQVRNASEVWQWTMFEGLGKAKKVATVNEKWEITKGKNNKNK